jgi:micrococcal nuclease
MTHLLATIVALAAILAGYAPTLQAQDRRPSGGAALAALGSRFSARVVAVADGDTIEVTARDGRRVRIRLEGIDCPERGEPFSNVARNFTRQLAFDRTVSVDARDVDSYGRLVARVTSEGKDLSLELVSAGLASHYTVFSFDAKLEAAEQRARRERRGMWVNGAARSPRARERAAPSPALRLLPAPTAEGAFFGNVRSRVYHAETCRNARCRNCTREFKTEGEAREAGFRPAGDCVGRR